MKGKIIAVIGAPGCGKSFLVKKLAEYYKAESILEGEVKDFPKYIIEIWKTRTKNFELFVWFRNKLIKEMKHAEHLKKQGKTVIIDTFWAINFPYANSFFKGYDLKIAKEMMSIDKEFLSYPDVIIYLKTSSEHAKKLIHTRGRSFELNDEYIRLREDIEKEHTKFFKGPRVIILNRKNLDFNRPKDLELVVKKVEGVIRKLYI